MIRRVFPTLLCLCASLAGFAQAKYVFYFIGDGMGMGHVCTTETYNRDILGSPEPILMMRFPVASQVRTYSASSPITDSAAGGTALSTGCKTRNNMVGMTPDTLNAYSISRDFMEAGRAVGVLTSVGGNDATPAAFYAHRESRKPKDLMLPFALESGLTFLGGGDFQAKDDASHEAFKAEMAKRGYSVVYSEEEVTGREDKVLMMSPSPLWEQIGYTIDSIPGAMTLPQMTRSALRVLRNDPDGFMMMCEGGNIDWAAHANDGAAVIKEILNFQEAINVAYDFYLQHPDETLIVITADHDTGGMALGRHDNKGNPQLRLIDFQKISKDRFADWCKFEYSKEEPSWERMRAFIEENLGLWGCIGITPEEDELIRTSFEETFITRRAQDQQTLYKEFNDFTVKVWDILNKHYGIGFTSSGHTGNFVPLYAVGSGSELFTGSLENTDVPKLILKAAGLK